MFQNSLTSTYKFKIFPGWYPNPWTPAKGEEEAGRTWDRGREGGGWGGEREGRKGEEGLWGGNMRYGLREDGCPLQLCLKSLLINITDRRSFYSAKCSEQGYRLCGKPVFIWIVCIFNESSWSCCNSPWTIIFSRPYYRPLYCYVPQVDPNC